MSFFSAVFSFVTFGQLQLQSFYWLQTCASVSYFLLYQESGWISSKLARVTERPLIYDFKNLLIKQQQKKKHAGLTLETAKDSWKILFLWELFSNCGKTCRQSVLFTLNFDITHKVNIQSAFVCLREYFKFLHSTLLKWYRNMRFTACYTLYKIRLKCNVHWSDGMWKRAWAGKTHCSSSFTYSTLAKWGDDVIPSNDITPTMCKHDIILLV